MAFNTYYYLVPSDFFKIPNLISAGRLILLWPTAHFLSQPGTKASFLALACLTVAGLSDYLDGYLARRLNQKTQLGLVLDPLADKIMAGVVVVLLIMYRDFSLSLAVVILGRDLLILTGGLVLRRMTGYFFPSIISGKYCFAAIAVLLVSQVITFDFGIRLFTVIVILLMALSIILYVRIFLRARHRLPAPEFSDRPIYKRTRILITLLVSAVYLYELLCCGGYFG